MAMLGFFDHHTNELDMTAQCLLNEISSPEQAWLIFGKLATFSKMVSRHCDSVWGIYRALELKHAQVGSLFLLVTSYI